MIDQWPGAYAALVTPVGRIAGEPDLEVLDSIIDLVLAGGMNGICIGGATSEYPHWTVPTRKRLLSEAAHHAGGRCVLLAAVGGPTLADVWALGDHALQSGYHALLLPMPYFYRYDQADLAEFCRAACDRLAAPLYLYNLPAMANGLAAETIQSLLAEMDGLAGIKDSSGDPRMLRQLAANRGRPECRLLVGADELILEGLQLGWNGLISGVASCCPELPAGLMRAWRHSDPAEAGRLQGLLTELCERLDQLPFPWGIRTCLEHRGYPTGARPWPVSEQRRTRDRELRDWLERWLPAAIG